MSRSIKWVVALMVISTTATIAEISLGFTADARFKDAQCLRIKGTLALNFIIDQSGQVMLDASVDGTNSADVRTTVNGWDGVVGAVTSPSLFNTSFVLAADAWRRNDAGNAFEGRDICISGDDSGYLGVAGQSFIVIDGASSPNKNREQLVWTLTAPSVQVEITSFSWDGRGVIQKRNMMLFDQDTTNSWYKQPDAGEMNISDYVVVNGETIAFSIPEDAIIGYGLSGFTFEVVAASGATSFSSNMDSRKSTSIGLLIY